MAPPGLAALLAALLAAQVLAAPVTLDQRQDGKFNLRANLDNFLILIAIPSYSEANSSSSNLVALDDLTQLFLERKHQGPIEAHEPEPAEEAPKPEKHQEAVQLASSREKHARSVKKDKIVDKTEPIPKPIRASDKLPPQVKPRPEVVAHKAHPKEHPGTGGHGAKGKSPGKWKTVEEIHSDPRTWVMVGSGLEGCGPGRRRNKKGVCEDEHVVRN